jgi:cyclin-dependent kinase
MRDRPLGTPTEQTWPSVNALPSFKSTFPQWNRDESQPLIQRIGKDGHDLLEAMLEYDPSRRISAKRAWMHPYLKKGTVNIQLAST